MLQSIVLGGLPPQAWLPEEVTAARERYVVRRGHLVDSSGGRERIVPRPYDRPGLIQQAHESLAHVGSERVLRALEETYTWVGMSRDVREYCSMCLPCQMQSAIFRRRATLAGHLAPS